MNHITVIGSRAIRQLNFIPFIGFLFLVSFHFNAFSQTVTIPIDSLEKTFPEESVVINKSDVLYRFQTDNSGKPESVLETSEDMYVSLKEKVQAMDFRFYDSYSEITKHKVKGSGYFNQHTSQWCGPYEIDGTFHHDAKSCNFLLRFHEPGQYLTVKTSKTFYDLKYFTSISFSKPYGIKKRHIRFEIPENIEVELLEMNFDGFDIEKEIVFDDKRSIKVIEYVLSDIPASHGLEDTPGFACTYPHVLVLTKAYTLSGQRYSLIENTDDLYGWYHSLVRNSLLSPELIELAEDLCKGKDSDSARIASIYYWVQDNIRYLAYHEGYAAFVPESPVSVYKSRYGDCKGMANLTKALLRHHGYDARLCWVNSGNSCYDRDIPSIAVDNHIICALFLGDSIIYLDPTSEFSPLYEINGGIQGKQGIIEDGDQYILAQIPPRNYRSNLRFIESEIELSGDHMLLRGNIGLRGWSKDMFQNFVANIPTENKEEFIEYFITEGDYNLNILELNSSDLSSKCDEINMQFEIELPNEVIDLGDELLVNLDLYEEFKQYKIDSTRRYSFAFRSTLFYKHQITLSVPEGFVVARLPDALQVEHSKFEFKATYQVDGQKVYYNKELSVKDNILRPDEFHEWNEAVDQLADFYNNVIILEKKQ